MNSVTKRNLYVHCLAHGVHNIVEKEGSSWPAVPLIFTALATCLFSVQVRVILQHGAHAFVCMCACVCVCNHTAVEGALASSC